MTSKVAIHACTVEAFGISVAEYLQAGLIPVVPREGGAAEVVGISELCYSSIDEGAAILARALLDGCFYDTMLSKCKDRARYFTKDAYFKRQGALVRQLREGVIKR